MESRSIKSSLADVMGNGLVVKGSDLIQSLKDQEKPASFVTHIEALDELQGNGLKAGSLIEIIGTGSSGRFSLELFILGAATHAGDAAAFLDCGGHLDPQQAVRAGIDLERLLWLSPANVTQALLSAELLLQAGFFLVVIDLGISNELPSIPNAVWLRLARVAQELKSIVVVSSRTSLETLASDAVLYSEKTLAKWDGVGKAPKLLNALDVHLRLRSRRGFHAEKRTVLSLSA